MFAKKNLSSREVDNVNSDDVPEEAQETKRPRDSITVTKTTVWQGVSAILGLLLIISVFTGGFKGSPTGDVVKDAMPAEAKPAEPAVAPASAPTPAPEIDMEALLDDDDVKGDADAPVTIVEWSDFECPYCGRFYSQTFGQIDENYIKTGKVKLAFRDFPLGFHSNAQKSAEAAECAGELGKFWEMHDLLFEKGVVGGPATYKGYAAEIGLEQAAFDDCLDSGKMADEVKKDMADGQAAGIRGTPAFIINGKTVSGAQPYDVFAGAIEDALK
ncbi:MAG: DsbA family protein [archaeon]